MVHRWMEDNPQFTGRASLYATPHIEVMGSEKFMDCLNQTRQDIGDLHTQNFWGPTCLGTVAGDFENERQDLFERRSGFDRAKDVEDERQ